MIACACVCSSLAWLWRRSSRHSNAVWNREHTKSFLATFTKSGGPYAHALARLPPSSRGTNRPRLSTRPYTQGAGKGDTHWPPLWHTATVVHHVHASTSLRAAKPRRAVGLPQHQEGRCPCSSSQVLDAHPPCFTRTRCTISQYTPAQRFPWYPWTFSNDDDVVFL